MLHRNFLREVRHGQVNLLVADGLARDEAERQIALVTDAALMDEIHKAGRKCGAVLPAAAFEPDGGHVGAIHLPDGHRIKQLQAWLTAHPGFEKAMKIGLSILITILISGT